MVILPNSFGPFDGLTVPKQIKGTLSRCHAIYAREHVSSKALAELLGSHVPVMPDLGFYLAPSSNAHELDSVLKKYNINTNDKIVGVTVRPWRFPGHSNSEALYESYLESVGKFIDYAEGQGFKVAVCNQSLGPNSHEDDRNAIRHLRNITTKFIWIDEDLPCDLLKAVYSRFYCLVGTRFHSVIFALTSRVPCIAIGYGGNKANGIMTDFGMDDFVIPISEVSFVALIECFQSISKGYDEVVKRDELIKEVRLSIEGS